MNSKVIGGILLIVGTSVGGGMLALPMATAAGGYLNSTLVFLMAWSITVVTAFYILEVNLWLPEGTNLISMARITLGPLGQIVTWITYLLLLYSLLAAYTAGGSDLLHNLFSLAGLQVPRWADSLLFTVVLGSILYFGVHTVDLANRGLMTIKLLAYALLVALASSHIKFENLMGGNFRLLGGAVMVIITSFGYATIVPTLRRYFKSDLKALKLTIGVGSVIPLLCYLVWDMVVQGVVDSGGEQGLINIGTSSRPISGLTEVLSAHSHSILIYDVTHLFTSICVTTSFLGVSLCLSDFLADGLRMPKIGWKRGLNTVITLGPALLIVLFYPNIFVESLSYAGLFCVILLILLPALMVWSGRYGKKISKGYQVWGGKGLIIAVLVVSLLLLFLDVYTSFAT
jgi:tyrosine-specific transport protein